MAGRGKGWNKIDAWLDTVPHEEGTEFRIFARKNYHNKVAIKSFLEQRGLEIALRTVYNWVGTNIVPGREAAVINLETEDYTGIEIIPLMERVTATLYKVSNLLVSKIEEDGLGRLEIGDAVHSLPLVTRDLKDYLKLISQTTNRIDSVGLVMEGATRIVEIVMGSPLIRDTPDEAYMRKVLESAILQVNAECESQFANAK
jgi:hypothetical protein